MNCRVTLPALVVTLALGVALAPSAQAMPIVFVGQDGQNNTTNSDNAFANWQASVGGAFTLDNLDGILGADDSAVFRSTDMGNVFTTASGDDLLGGFTLTTNVLEGTFLRVTQGPADDVSTFTWSLAKDADAFGFFGRDNDGGVVTIGFNDGTVQQYTVDSLGPNDNMFWGISGLAGTVSSVVITSTDPDAVGSRNSAWDRFVYRAVDVPEPSAFVLGLAGLLVLTPAGKRRLGSRRVK